MSSAVMARRGIKPIDTKNVVINTHILVFDVFGVPFTEPAMAGIKQMPADHSGPSVHGVAYLLSASDYNRLKVSEGAGTGYQEVMLDAEVVGGLGDLDQGPAKRRDTSDVPGTVDGVVSRRILRGEAAASNPTLTVSTLVARHPFHPTPPPLPSLRYMVRDTGLIFSKGKHRTHACSSVIH